MKKCLIGLICAVVFVSNSYGAETPPKACQGEAYKALDFWLGKWQLNWDGGQGTNHIIKTYGGCVVQENFKSSDSQGMSISMFHKQAGQWRQTWMDDQGGFFDLYGRKEGDNYIFQTMTDPSKPQHHKRMLFTNITKNSLIWVWQKTQDDGKSWQEMWKIKYSRSPEKP